MKCTVRAVETGEGLDFHEGTFRARVFPCLKLCVEVDDEEVVLAIQFLFLSLDLYYEFFSLAIKC